MTPHVPLAPIMYSFLPDELLKEILAPALQVPDESFACATGKSPFSNYNPTTSAYLLVCKAWLRVATPLLYSVVVLRSKAQIQALESAINSTPLLGGLVKKLRVESGYCGSLLTILRAAKNLTDLCLSLEVYSNDTVAAFCKGFMFINPTRLIIFDIHNNRGGHVNQKAQQLTKSIQAHIEIWNKLTKVVLPSWPQSYWGFETKYDEYVDAIVKSKTIEVVSITAMYSSSGWFERLAKTPNLKKIIVRNGQPTINTPFAEKIKGSAKLTKLIQWGEDVPRVSLTPVRMAVASDEPEVRKRWLKVFPKNVWINIFFYTLGLDELEQSEFSELGRTIPSEYLPTNRRRLFLVCKRFYKLLKPLFFRCAIIQCDHDLQNLVDYIYKCKEAGNQVKTLLTIDKSHGSTLTRNLLTFIAHTPKLKRVSTIISTWSYSSTTSYDIFDWQSFVTLAQQAGGSLEDLGIHLHRPTQPKSPDVFYQFTELRNLEFASSARFNFEPVRVRDALPKLESITCTSINNTFLSFLSFIDLPNIKHARFPIIDKCEGAITFLQKHGSKLLSLELGFLPGVSVFDICPNLEKFVVPLEKPGFAVAEFFSSSDEHPLTTLHISTKDVAKGAEKEKFKYIGGLDLSNFTSLHEIQIDKCGWPTTENEIKKSHWVAWAERLQELYRVDILDKEGQKWVPRLKAKSDK